MQQAIWDRYREETFVIVRPTKMTVRDLGRFVWYCPVRRLAVSVVQERRGQSGVRGWRLCYARDWKICAKCRAPAPLRVRAYHMYYQANGVSTLRMPKKREPSGLTTTAETLVLSVNLRPLESEILA